MRYAAHTLTLCTLALAVVLAAPLAAQETELPTHTTVVQAPDTQTVPGPEGHWVVNRGKTKIANWRHYSTNSGMNVIEFGSWIEDYLGEQQGFELVITPSGVSLTMSDQWKEPLLGRLVEQPDGSWRVADCFPATWQVSLHQNGDELVLEGLEIHALVLDRQENALAAQR